MAPQETGYETLLKYKMVPQVLGGRIETWDQLLGIVRSLEDNPQGVLTVVLDALIGFQKLCFQFVCDRDYGGVWGKKGFMSYREGFDVSVTEWTKLLSALDRIRDKEIGTLCLSHAKPVKFENPDGANYDRWVSDAHHKIWDAMKQWSDALLFGNFFEQVETSQENKQKGKGIGGDERVVYFTHKAAHDAKNRHGDPEPITLLNDPKLVWSTITNTLKGGSDASH